jgi:pimeloyl-ACP methyl ester carboxylesterase
VALVEAEDGVRLACRREGNAHDAPVLLIPDWLGSSRLYEEMVPALGEAGLSALVYDPRGTGRSDRPENGYGLRREAQDALLVLDRLSDEAVWVAAQGYGALVGLALAAVAPDRVKGLTLVAPIPLTGLGADGARIRAMRRLIEDWRGLADFVASTSANRLDPQRLRAVAEDMAHTTRAAGLAQLDRMLQPGLQADAGRLAAPIRVVAGEYDEWVGRERLRLGLMAYLAGARLEVLERIGHQVALEVPGELARRIREHVEFPAGQPELVLEEPELSRPPVDGAVWDGETEVLPPETVPDEEEPSQPSAD